MAVTTRRNARHASVAVEQRQLGLTAHPHVVALLLAALAATATASALASLFTLG